jgi:short-subunit dehydrogenase involved in D-alanine esterification of teichoic acids
MKLEGHRVFITGGSAGIGLALAGDFLAAGCRVAVCGRDPRRLASAERALPGLVTLQGDVAEDDDIARLAAGAEERLEGLSILVNNAGIQFQTLFSEDPLEEIVTRVEREIAVNLTGLVKLTATCLPALARAEEAAVVNVSSGLALVPKASAPIYCATKAAVHSFSKALRFQLEDHRPSVRVFEVLPPMVDTQMTAGRGERPGQKITTAQVARETLDGMRRDRYEINVAKVKLLKWVNRFAPGVAERILRNV